MRVSRSVGLAVLLAPLAGAEVQIVPVDGAHALAAWTDAGGRVRVDSAPAGRYRVGFLRPRVDPLGIGVAPVLVDPHDDRAQVALTVPSAAVASAVPDDVPVTLTTVRTYLDTVKVLSRRAFVVDRGDALGASVRDGDSM